MHMTLKKELYMQAYQSLEWLLDWETNLITIMASINSVLKHTFDYYFWVWFYLVDRPGYLKVWPYQWTVWCINIPFEKGVCGACATKQETIIVPDVHAFPWHIACDSRSNSEIVVPVFHKWELYAVFDVDSESFGSFDEDDKEGIERIMKTFFNN